MATVGSPAQTVLPHVKAHPMLGVVAVACAYELAADVLNDTVGITLLPSMRNGIQRFTWRAFGRRVVPRWSLQAGLVAVGFVGTVAARKRTAAATARKRAS